MLLTLVVVISLVVGVDLLIVGITVSRIFLTGIHLSVIVWLLLDLLLVVHIWPVVDLDESVVKWELL